MSVSAPEAFSNVRTADEIWEAAKNIPETVHWWTGEEGPRHFVEVSFGTIRTLSKDPGKWNRNYEARMERLLRENPGMASTPGNVMVRGKITAWSRKSRSRMTRTLAQIDYGPLIEQVRYEGHTPAMVTLTLPHDWETVAGDAHTYKQMVEKWKTRYRYTFGHMPKAVWKMEFQYRKECAASGCHDPRAPHLHLLMAIPHQDKHGEPVDFREWVSAAWNRTVKHPDPDERAKHLAAGTNVAESDLTRYSDIKRIAVYFSKHGAFKDKEYQNTPPASWEMADKGGAHFWGRWQLKTVTVTREVRITEIMSVRRHLRKLANCAGYSRPAFLDRTNRKTGVVRKRKANRRVRQMKSGNGWILVNDGVNTAWGISRIIAAATDGGFLDSPPDHAPQRVGALHRDFHGDYSPVAKELVHADCDHLAGYCVRVETARKKPAPVRACRHAEALVG